MLFDGQFKFFKDLELKQYGVEATLRQRGLPDTLLTGAFEQPGLEEDEIPGSTPGVSRARFFVDYSSFETPPRKGDHLFVNGREYNIGDIQGQLDGGATLILSQ